MTESTRTSDYFTFQGYSYNFLMPYDPTNGTVSQGDLMRSQKHPEEKCDMP